METIISRFHVNFWGCKFHSSTEAISGFRRWRSFSIQVTWISGEGPKGPPGRSFGAGMTKWGCKTHQKGWFIRETPMKMDDLGVPLFLDDNLTWLDLGCVG